MKKLLCLIIFVYVGDYSTQPVYVNPESVVAIHSVADFGQETIIELDNGHIVRTVWLPLKVKEALEESSRHSRHRIGQRAGEVGK